MKSLALFTCLLVFAVSLPLTADPEGVRRTAKQIIDEKFAVADVPGFFLPGYKEFLAIIPELSKDFHLTILKAAVRTAVNSRDRVLVSTILPRSTAEAIRFSVSEPQAKNLASLLTVLLSDNGYTVDENIWKIVRDTRNAYAQEAIGDVIHYEGTVLKYKLGKNVRKINGHPADTMMLHLENAATIQSEPQLEFFRLIAAIRHDDYPSAHSIMGYVGIKLIYEQIYESLPFIRSNLQVDAFRELIPHAFEIASRREQFQVQVGGIFYYMKPFMPQLHHVADSPQRLKAFLLCMEVLKSYRGRHYNREGHKLKEKDKSTDTVIYNEILPKLGLIDSEVRLQFARRMVFPESEYESIIDLRWFARIQESEASLQAYMAEYGRDKTPQGSYPKNIFGKILLWCGLGK